MKKREFPGKKNLKDCAKRAIAGSQKFYLWGTGGIPWDAATVTQVSNVYSAYRTHLAEKILDKTKMILM